MTWGRALDMNDRALRNVVVGLGRKIAIIVAKPSARRATGAGLSPAVAARTFCASPMI